ncbi:DUF4129 domain-containing protein [Nocardioides guangzhouensis]|uniref:DUF4129 domain-containing protein n=1 Tax=Nocardioides guangzhouensis TaxID=2497878 RepID=A0A4Q4Z443_9ACTN|nr:DUF4129 domain-containing protein [Nocardioides guangzhouensis]RYP82487.1 DUF4129 domain-containing protein [Nocardioides guangzhouensis]
MWQRRGPTAVIVFLALAGVLLVTWAATVGPTGVLGGDGPMPHPREAPTTFEPLPETAEEADQDEQQQGDSLVADFVGVVGQAVAVVVGIAALVLAGLLLVLAARGVRRLVEEVAARRGPPDPEATAFDALDARTRLARAITEDADRQRDLLTSGSPRNGIVHCWHRFEELAGEAGIGRHTWEAPGEFALRILTTIDADEDAAYRLTTLYREARFSHHELDEVAREEALDALVTIHLGLAARTGIAP